MEFASNRRIVDAANDSWAVSCTGVVPAFREPAKRRFPWDWPDRSGIVVEAWQMGWMAPYILVGVGGFLGANARFLMARWIGGVVETRFPLGTFVINISGSFLLGVLGALVAQKVFRNPDAVRLALGVGFLGGFTTYSTFMFESHALLDDGEWLVVATNVALSVFVGLVAVRLGIVAARNWMS